MLKSKITAAVLTLGVAALWSSQAAAQDPMATPPMRTGLGTGERTQRETRRPNVPMLASGATILAASYTPALLVAMNSERRGDDRLYIPVAGPWLDLAERGGCAPNSCETEALYKAGLVAMGVAHLVGTGLVIGSFIAPETRTVTRSAKAVVVPTSMGRGGAGLSVVGRF